MASASAGREGRAAFPDNSPGLANMEPGQNHGSVCTLEIPLAVIRCLTGSVRPSGNLDGLTAAGLRALLLELIERVRDLERQLAVRDGEMVRLKSLKARPDIKQNRRAANNDSG